jgi:sugar phosphate isomerase/epimerase
MKPTFSITTDLAGQKADVAPIFAAFAKGGFAAAHWCQDWVGEPVFYSAAFAQRVGGLAAGCGLRVADVHGYSGTSDTGITYSDELFAAVNVNRAEFAARVGAGVLVLHLPPHGAPKVAAGGGAAAIEEAARRAADLAAEAVGRLLGPCHKLGVRLAVENLTGPAYVPAFYDALFQRLGPEELGFCYDSGHALVCGQADLVVRYAGRLLATHLHDNDGTADQHRLAGEGRADWPMILGAIKRSAYAGTVNLEVHLPAGMELEAFCTLAFGRLKALWNAAPA